MDDPGKVVIAVIVLIILGALLAGGSDNKR